MSGECDASAGDTGTDSPDDTSPANVTGDPAVHDADDDTRSDTVKGDPTSSASASSTSPSCISTNDEERKQEPVVVVVAAPAPSGLTLELSGSINTTTGRHPDESISVPSSPTAGPTDTTTTGNWFERASAREKTQRPTPTSSTIPISNYGNQASVVGPGLGPGSSGSSGGGTKTNLVPEPPPPSLKESFFVTPPDVRIRPISDSVDSESPSGGARIHSPLGRIHGDVQIQSSDTEVLGRDQGDVVSSTAELQYSLDPGFSLAPPAPSFRIPPAETDEITLPPQNKREKSPANSLEDARKAHVQRMAEQFDPNQTAYLLLSSEGTQKLAGFVYEPPEPSKKREMTARRHGHHHKSSSSTGTVEYRDSTSPDQSLPSSNEESTPLLPSSIAATASAPKKPGAAGSTHSGFYPPPAGGLQLSSAFLPGNEKGPAIQQFSKNKRAKSFGLAWAIAHGVGSFIAVLQTFSLMCVIWAVAYRCIILLPCLVFGCITLLSNFAIFSLSTSSTRPNKSPPFKPRVLPFEFIPPHAAVMIFAALFDVIDIFVSLIWVALVRNILIFTAIEPNGDKCDDWFSFFVLCILSMIMNWFAIGIQALGLFCVAASTIASRGYCKQLRKEYLDSHHPHKSCWNVFKYVLDGVVGVLILVCLILVIVPLALLMSDYNYCNPSSESCYENCNPYDPSMCMLPFPSTFYLKNDSSTVTGWRVDINKHASVRDRWGEHVGNTEQLNELDGFSVSAPILCYFEEASLDGVISLSNLSAYTSPTAKTVLIDTTTNTLVPHWVELDAMDQKTPLLLIQPDQVLKHATRYVVGIRWLLNKNGKYILRAPYFDSVLKNQSGEDWSYLSKNVWPYVQDKGWLLDDVLLMWDFVTASEEFSLGRVQLMLGEANSNWAGRLSYSFDEIETHECTPGEPGVAKSLWGHFDGPKFVSQKRGGLLLSRPGAKQILLDDDTLRVSFLIEIPCSLWLAPEPAFILQFGHGLFEDRSEIQESWMRNLSFNKKWITFAVDWYGFSRLDTLVLSRILLRDLSNFVSIPECTMQSFINAHLMLKLMTLQVVNDPELQVSGTRLIDPSKHGFYGLSEGSIVGGGYLGMSDMLGRAAMSVGGTPFAVILPRSLTFRYVNALLRITVYTQRDVRLLLSLYQALWDAGEVAGWLESLNREPKPVLIQAALDDPVVTNYATHILARSLLNGTLIAPEAAPVWPLPSQAPPAPSAPTGASWLVEWVFQGVKSLPDTSCPPPSSSPNPHLCPCTVDKGQDQVWQFLTNGTISQYCQGVCEAPLCQ
ncbi:ATP-dependent DNA helicase RecG [Pelomyxa schiedti]|nr:ATP-dependent DNA helicase RecG [Pelomyxa schiedti]